MEVIGVLIVSALPIGLSLWALLDAANRPAWAWALAERSQLAWLVAILFGLFSVVLGAAISAWYLLRVRPAVRRVEDGDLGSVLPDDDSP